MLGMIDRERRRLKQLQEVYREHEAMERRAEVDAGSVPDVETVRALAQYQLAVDRQMYAALGQLERLQRARMGETLYSLVRFASTASESQIRSLKKLTASMVTVAPNGTRTTKLIEALRLEAK